jgi:acetylornithine/N-succinyldiaminopimelate aminotransferase
MKHILWSIGHKLEIEDIIKSDNCYLFDKNGEKYIDLLSGIWCTNVGHNNSRINAVITSQINKITHTGYCYSNPIIEESAKTILEINNFNEGKCEFLNSGSEAVEFGMRVARTITDKPLALTFSDSYFGAYGEASVKNNKSWHIYNWLDCSCNKRNKGCIGECDAFNNIPFELIGTFLFEPGSSSGLVRFPSQKLINKIIERIKQNDGIIVINEITTGIGRTGKWFGYQHYKILPDIVAMGKALGNGYPVSATVISKSISQLLEKKEFIYSQSHQNDPLGAKVAKEVIEIINGNKLLDRCVKLGDKLISGLNKIKNNNSIIKEIRGRGLMIGIELFEQAEIIRLELQKRGFILVKRSDVEVLRMDPALTIEEHDLESFLLNLEKILLDVKRKTANNVASDRSQPVCLIY